MNNCPKCGMPLAPGDTICSNCGEPVNNVMPTTNEQPVDPNMYNAQSMGNFDAVQPTTDYMPIEAMPTVPEQVPSVDVPGAYEVPLTSDYNNPMPTNMESTYPSYEVAPEAVPPVVDEESIKKKEAKVNKILFIVAIVVSVLALGVMLFFMIKMFSTSNEVEESSLAENTRQYYYEGYNFYLPDGITAEIHGGDFYLGNDEEKWSAVMTLGEGSYNTLVSNKAQIVDYFDNLGYRASEPVEKEIGATSFVITEVVIGKKNVMVAYAKANGTQIFGIILQNESGTYTDDNLRPIGTILSTMKYSDPNYELPTGLDMNQFHETFDVGE